MPVEGESKPEPVATAELYAAGDADEFAPSSEPANGAMAMPATGYGGGGRAGSNGPSPRGSRRGHTC